MAENKMKYFPNKNIGLKTFQINDLSAYIPLSQYVPISKNIKSVPKKLEQTKISDVSTFSIYETEYISRTVAEKKDFLTGAKEKITKIFHYFNSNNKQIKKSANSLDYLN